MIEVQLELVSPQIARQTRWLRPSKVEFSYRRRLFVSIPVTLADALGLLELSTVVWPNGPLTFVAKRESARSVFAEDLFAAFFYPTVLRADNTWKHHTEQLKIVGL
ncbi:hypothetical protein C0Q70_02798 [Pomacea canaliculata]|uniref:Uncharacterized protein n=1 Tax=Pomacea canaliculata TaxID=400727 RepID=A0A2T7PQX8_POMCA|nr:hypothetical protein C0Q70_02798 [Pomacea canaliculata]